MEIDTSELIRRMMKRKNNRSQAIILSFVALVTIIIGISDIVSTMSFINNAESAEGEILDMVRQNTGNSYAPVFSFTTKEGKYIEVKSNKATIPRLEIGDKIKVFYDPFIPQKAIINNFGQNGGWGLIFCIVGIILAYSAVKSFTKVG